MKITDDELIDAVLEAGDPFASTPEIADLEAVPITRRGVHNRLVSLADGGEIARKDVGQTTVWWVPRSNGPAVTASDVYTDGGVAQRVEGLDDQINQLEDTAADLEDVVADLKNETIETRKRVTFNHTSAVRGMGISVTLLLVGVVSAVFESLLGFSNVLIPISGVMLLFGLVSFVYYVGRLFREDDQISGNSIW
ncbi:MAG: hypothetical protein ABEH78_06815 [Haloferacaceae archaeon]